MKKTVSSALVILMALSLMVPFFAVSGAALDANAIPATDEILTVDGIKEDIYSLGKVYISSLNDGGANNYDGTAAFTASVVWDGIGKTYCFVEVIDSEIVVNDALWAAKWWHCDSWQLYIDFGAAATSGTGTQWTFAADPTGTYKKSAPSEYKVVLTDVGYNVEFAFDNNGAAFVAGDTFGFGPYLNACFNYTDAALGNGTGYNKSTVSISYAKSADPNKYQGPAAANYDDLVLSAEKVSSAPETTVPSETEPTPAPETGDTSVLVAVMACVALTSVIGAATLRKRETEK